MDKHVVIINGTGGVGKDTLISEFREIVDGAYSVSIVDTVKSAAMYLGWNKGKTDEDRKALAELKDFSDKYWLTPINYIIGKYELWMRYPEYNWLFITAREPKDIATLVEAIPEAKTVLVTREGINSHGNHADDNVNDYEYDLVFENKEGIKESSMNFVEAIVTLFGESIPFYTDSELVDTNINGVRFFDINYVYGLGEFTVLGSHKYYEYYPNAEHPYRWLQAGIIDVKVASGKIFNLPFNPSMNVVDVHGKSFKEYYDEQPWLEED